MEETQERELKTDARKLKLLEEWVHVAHHGYVDDTISHYAFACYTLDVLMQASPEGAGSVVEDLRRALERAQTKMGCDVNPRFSRKHELIEKIEGIMLQRCAMPEFELSKKVDAGAAVLVKECGNYHWTASDSITGLQDKIVKSTVCRQDKIHTLNEPSPNLDASLRDKIVRIATPPPPVLHVLKF